MLGQKLSGTLRIMFAEVAHPPGHGLLHEPVAVIGVACRPIEDAVAGGEFFGFGVVEFGKGQGRHKGGTAGPHQGALRPAFYLVKAGRVGGDALLRGDAGGVGDGPGVELWHPGADQIPGAGIIRTDAGLRQQFGGGDAGLRAHCCPKGQRQGRGGRRASSSCRHVFGQRIDRGDGRRQDRGAPPCDRRPFRRLCQATACSVDGGQRLIGRHSTVTDLARLRG